MRVDQDKVFVESEGDRWFERNKEALDKFDPERDIPLRLMTMYGLRPRTVLELGASSGARLAEIHRACGARVVAVEASRRAVCYGKSRFSDVKFIQGQAHKIPLRRPFDLIIANFLFHWIDRAHLLGLVAEMDRLLVDGGFLLLGDFYPPHPMRVPYHHVEDRRVYTYKQDYAQVFLASGIYQLTCALTGDHGSLELQTDVSRLDRIGVCLLRKQYDDGYVETPFHRAGTSSR